MGALAGEEIFASGLLNSSFAQIRSAVKRKKLINGVAVCLAATVPAVGWKASRHFILLPFGCVTLLFRRAVHLPACQWACAEVSMQPVFEHACVLEVCGSLSDFLFGHYWVRSQ